MQLDSLCQPAATPCRGPILSFLPSVRPLPLMWLAAVPFSPVVCRHRPCLPCPFPSQVLVLTFSRKRYVMTYTDIEVSIYLCIYIDMHIGYQRGCLVRCTRTFLPFLPVLAVFCMPLRWGCAFPALSPSLPFRYRGLFVLVHFCDMGSCVVSSGRLFFVSLLSAADEVCTLTPPLLLSPFFLTSLLCTSRDARCGVEGLSGCAHRESGAAAYNRLSLKVGESKV